MSDNTANCISIDSALLTVASVALAAFVFFFKKWYDCNHFNLKEYNNDISNVENKINNYTKSSVEYWIDGELSQNKRNLLSTTIKGECLDIQRHLIHINKKYPSFLYKDRVQPLCIEFWKKSTGGKFDSKDFSPCKITITNIQAISGEIAKELNDAKVSITILNIIRFKIKSYPRSQQDQKT